MEAINIVELWVDRECNYVQKLSPFFSHRRRRRFYSVLFLIILHHHDDTATINYQL